MFEKHELPNVKKACMLSKSEGILKKVHTFLKSLHLFSKSITHLQQKQNASPISIAKL